MAPNRRTASGKHHETVQEIARAAYTRYIARIGRKPVPMLDDYVALTDADRVHVVESDVVLAIPMLIRQDHTMLLHNVAVAPEEQGSNLGRPTLKFAERTAVESGHRTIEAMTGRPSFTRVEFDRDRVLK